jgi:hypothetical protein
MTLPRFSPMLVRRRLSLALLGCCLIPVLAACAGAAAQVKLPPKPAKATAAVAASPASLPPRQQVVAALTGYVSALGQADKSKDPATARRLLGPYLAAGRIGGLVQAVSGIWAKGESFYGQDELHVLSVRISGRHAFVHDCDNTSGMGLEDAAGQPLPGTAGVPAANLVTRLDLVGGRWLVEFQLIEDVPCAP